MKVGEGGVGVWWGLKGRTGWIWWRHIVHINENIKDVFQRYAKNQNKTPTSILINTALNLKSCHLLFLLKFLSL